MHIECPSCQIENKIDYADKILCSSCKESFAGHAYKKFKKPLISASTALIIGIYGTYKVDDLYFDEARYPVAIEYELIDSCVNSSSRVLNKNQYIEKKKACSCALASTMEDVSYKEMKESESKFITRFKNSINQCL